MIDFQRLDISRREEYDRFLRASGKGCEYSFVNLSIWGKQQAAFFEDSLVLFSQFGRSSIYPFPIIRGDATKVLDAIIADARERIGVSSAHFEETIEKLEQARRLLDRDRLEAAKQLRAAEEDAKKAARLRSELEVRLEKASELLLTTDMDIRSIAEVCGFSSQSYFTDVFHRHTELTPRMYRLRMMEKYIR